MGQAKDAVLEHWAGAWAIVETPAGDLIGRWTPTSPTRAVCAEQLAWLDRLPKWGQEILIRVHFSLDKSSEL